ncbi:MAG TPA: hypothetical protein VN982_15320 [Candidatus Dormibacteraeota bacterium]|nr:hypothetical protein [Candidatus Dormibacteraeota bacterium]
MKKHFSILAAALVIVTLTTFAVLAYPIYANHSHPRHQVIADGCPLPFPPHKIYDENAAAANSQFLVADGAPLPFPPHKIYDENAAVSNSQFLVADGAPLPFPPHKIYDDSVAA